MLFPSISHWFTHRPFHSTDTSRTWLNSEPYFLSFLSFLFLLIIFSLKKVHLAFIECRLLQWAQETEIMQAVRMIRQKQSFQSPWRASRTPNPHSKFAHQPGLSPSAITMSHPLPSTVSLQDFEWVGAMAILCIWVHMFFQGSCKPCLQAENREIEAKTKNEQGSLSGQEAEMGPELKFYKAKSCPDCSQVFFTLVHNLRDGSCEDLSAHNIGRARQWTESFKLKALRNAWPCVLSQEGREERNQPSNHLPCADPCARQFHLNHVTNNPAGS